MGELFVDIERCNACGACEAACAAEHATAAEIEAALLEAPSAPRDGRCLRLRVGTAYAYFERCMHCTDAPCMSACPNGAMLRDEKLDIVYVDESRCQGCFMCAASCPFGSIAAHPTRGIALKCNGCRDRVLRGESPACVSACQNGAIRLVPGHHLSRRRQSVAAKGLADAFGLSSGPPPVRRAPNRSDDDAGQGR